MAVEKSGIKEGRKLSATEVSVSVSIGSVSLVCLAIALPCYMCTLRIHSCLPVFLIGIEMSSAGV